MYDENDTIKRLTMVSEMAETLAEQLLTRVEPWDNTAHAQRLTLMRVAILLNDMNVGIPDVVLDAIEAANADASRHGPAERGAAPSPDLAVN